MYEEQTKNRRKARGVKNSNNQQTFFLDLLPGKIRDTKIIMISVYVFDIPGRPQRYWVDHDSFRTLLDQIILHTMILKEKKKS
jgi:hypothetical protein